MPFNSLDRVSLFIEVKTTRAQCDALVHFHIIADHTGFSDDNPRTMIDEEAPANGCTGVNVDPRALVRILCHDSRNNRNAERIEHMCKAVNHNGLKSRIGKQYFFVVTRSGVAVISGLYIKR